MENLIIIVMLPLVGSWDIRHTIWLLHSGLVSHSHLLAYLFHGVALMTLTLYAVHIKSCTSLMTFKTLFRKEFEQMFMLVTDTEA